MRPPLKSAGFTLLLLLAPTLPISLSRATTPLPSTGATIVSRQTVAPHSALLTSHSAPRTLLAQATDPRKEDADQFLKLCREQLQKQQYKAMIQACQPAANSRVLC